MADDTGDASMTVATATAAALWARDKSLATALGTTVRGATCFATLQVANACDLMVAILRNMLISARTSTRQEENESINFYCTAVNLECFQSGGQNDSQILHLHMARIHVATVPTCRPQTHYRLYHVIYTRGPR